MNTKQKSGINITIEDVAKLAGTSRSTVSRYLNSQSVKAETKKKIEEAIRQLNYRPNAIARGLALKKTNTIGIVLDRITNYFLMDIVLGIQTVVQQRNYNCVFYSSDINPDKEYSYVNLLYEGTVAGLILLGFEARDRSAVQKLADHRYPVVIVGDAAGQGNIASYDVDAFSGAYQAIAYLAGIGHRRIAHIAGPLSYPYTITRLHGYHKSLLDYQLEIIPELVVHTSGYGTYDGYKGAQQLLDKGVPFTAIFCGNDNIAVGTMHALRERGIDIPHDVSIVGFDNLPHTEWTYPPLTTVHQPRFELGTMAAEKLFSLINDRDQQVSRILLKPSLVIRQSCSPLQQSRNP